MSCLMVRVGAGRNKEILADFNEAEKMKNWEGYQYISTTYWVGFFFLLKTLDK